MIDVAKDAFRALAALATIAVLLSCDARPGEPGAGVPASPASSPSAVPGAGASVAASNAGGFPLPVDAREGRSADGTYVVRWAPVGGAIPELDPFAVAIEVRRTDGARLAPDARVFVDAEMPHHGHGMNLVPEVVPAPSGDPVADEGAARFLASGLLLHMTGKWVFAIDVEEAGLLERTQWHVEIE